MTCITELTDPKSTKILGDLVSLLNVLVDQTEYSGGNIQQLVEGIENIRNWLGIP